MKTSSPSLRELIMDIASSRDIMNDVIYVMLENNDPEMAWYANVLRQCVISYDESLEVFGAVYFSGQRGKFVIVFNRLLCSILPNSQIVALLKHELGHIILMHFERSTEAHSTVSPSTKYEFFLQNIAMDYTINGDRYKPLIKNLRGSCHTFDENGTMPSLSAVFWSDLKEFYQIDVDVSGKETYVDFYNILIKHFMEHERLKQNEFSCGTDAIQKTCKYMSSQQKKRSCGKLGAFFTEEDVQGALQIIENNQDVMANHDYIIGKEEETTVHFLDNEGFFKNKYEELKRIFHEATEVSRGFMPSSIIQHMIHIENRLATVNWKKILRHALAKPLRSKHRKLSFNRQNKILPDDPNVPGAKPAKKPKIGIVLDVSGSISNQFLSQALAEITRLAKTMKSEIETVQVDTEVKQCDKIKHTTHSINRSGCGGTRMEDGFAYFLNYPFPLQPSVIVCLTDGYIEQSFEDIKMPKIIDTIFIIPEKNELEFDCLSLRGRCTCVQMKL